MIDITVEGYRIALAIVFAGGFLGAFAGAVFGCQDGGGKAYVAVTAMGGFLMGAYATVALSLIFRALYFVITGQ